MGTAINNTFNISRFGLVLRKDFQENKKLYALGALLIFGSLATMMILVGYDIYDRNTNTWSEAEATGCMEMVRTGLFFGFLYLFTITLASTLFSKLKFKTGRIEALTLPASDLEKFMSRWIVVTIVFPIMYVLLFYLADMLYVLVLKTVYPYATTIEQLNIGQFNFLSIDNNVAVVTIYLCVQAVYVLGGVMMPKLSFVKTSCVLLVLTIIYTNFMTGVADVLKTGANITVVACSFAIYAVLLWIIAYFRFKETEVIHRLI